MNEFQKTVYTHYDENKRDMPWRNDTRAYYIVVSEIMLQQTQASRVIPKFNDFISVFPDFKSLANAKLSEVLLLWSGLGYNRRAKFLHELAKQVVSDHDGKLPSDLQELVALPGIGPNTAGAIQAYAFNMPVTYIETNIRTVFLYHFFEGESGVSDAQLMPIITENLDTTNPARWYLALMDYGVHLKKVLPNPSRRSKHHTQQTKFEGSKRQLRGNVLKLLLNQGSMELSQIKDTVSDERVESVIDDLQSEALLQINNNIVSLAE